MTSWLLLLESWFTDTPFQVCGLDWEPTWWVSPRQGLM